MTSKSLRILNICGYTWNIGGPPKVIFDHAEVQLRQGAEVTILTPISPGEVVYPAPAGARVVTCQRHWAARFYPEFSVELYKWLRKHGNDFDLIHIHGLWHFAGIAPFLLKLRPAKAITVHGLLDRWAWKKGKWKKALASVLFQRRFLRKADLIHVFNLDEEEDLRRYLGYVHPHTVIIPNGMKLSDYDHLPVKGAFRAANSIPADQKIILFISRLNNKKGLDLLLPAFERVCRVRDDVILILAGPDDGAANYTASFIRENQLEMRARMVGMLTGEAKLSAFVDANLFALPSYSEGFSIAALEALTIGTPALLSDRVGFGPELLEAQAAYILPELSSAAVEKGLEFLLDHEEHGKRMVENGKQLVKSRYDIQIVARSLLDAFQQASSRRNHEAATGSI